MNTYKTEAEVEENIVEFNKNRIKKPFQIYNELKFLKPIYSARADARKKSKLRQFSVGPDLGQRDNDKAINTDDELGLAVGMSGSKVHNLMYLYDSAEKKIANALKVLEKIKDEDMSTDAGYKYLKLMEASDNPLAKIKTATLKDLDIAAKAHDLAKKIELGSITPNKADENFKKYVKEYDNTSLKQATKRRTEHEKTDEIIEKTGTEITGKTDEITEKTEKETSDQLENENTGKPEETVSKTWPAGIYDVIVADPKNFKEVNDLLQLTFMRDSALFLWANIQNIYLRLFNLINSGYELVSIGIFDTEDCKAEYFYEDIEFILVGIRGEIEPSDYDPCVYLHQNDYKTKYDVVYEIVEKFFPDKRYLDPFNNTGREGWGKLEFIEEEEEKGKEKEEEKDKDAEEGTEESAS